MHKQVARLERRYFIVLGAYIDTPVSRRWSRGLKFSNFLLIFSTIDTLIGKARLLSSRLPAPRHCIKFFPLLLLLRGLYHRLSWVVLREGWMPSFVGDWRQIFTRILAIFLLVGLKHRTYCTQVLNLCLSLCSEPERVLDSWVNSTLHQVVDDADVPAG